MFVRCAHLRRCAGVTTAECRVAQSSTSDLQLAAHAVVARRAQYIHHPGHRLRAVQRGERSAHHFDLLDSGRGETAPVIAREVRIVDLDAVPHHERLRRCCSAREERGRFSWRAAAADGQTRNFTQEVGEIARRALIDILLRHHGDDSRSGLQGFGQCRGSDDDRFGEFVLSEGE